MPGISVLPQLASRLHRGPSARTIPPHPQPKWLALTKPHLFQPLLSWPTRISPAAPFYFPAAMDRGLGRTSRNARIGYNPPSHHYFLKRSMSPKTLRATNLSNYRWYLHQHFSQMILRKDSSTGCEMVRGKELHSQISGENTKSNRVKTGFFMQAFSGPLLYWHAPWITNCTRAPRSQQTLLGVLSFH